MGQVLGRDLVHGELAAIDAPLHVIGPHHLAGLVGIGLVVLLQRRIERRQVAAIRVRDHYLLLVGEGAAIGVAQGDLHLVAAPLGDLEVGGAGCRGDPRPHLLAIEQYLGGLAHVAGPEVPAHADGGTILVDSHQLVVGGGGLIDLDDGELGFTPAYGGFAGGGGEGGGGTDPPDQQRQQGMFWTEHS